jgi:hypothetical protein
MASIVSGIIGIGLGCGVLMMIIPPLDRWLARRDDRRRRNG